MRFPRRCAIWRICKAGMKDYRFATLGNAMLDGDYLIATEAHVLACVPITSRSARDVDGPIPWAALREAIQVSDGDETAEIACLKTKVKVAGKDFPRAPGKYPEWRKMMEMFEGKPKARFPVNASLLKLLAGAMGEHGTDVPLTIDIYADGAQALVRLADKELESIGLIMPMRLPAPEPLPAQLRAKRIRKKRVKR